MKPGVIYGIIFTIVFVLTSAGVFYVAEHYPQMMIFVDTGQDHSADSTHVQIQQKLVLDEEKVPEKPVYMPGDSVRIVKEVQVVTDTIYQKVPYQDPKLLDSLKKSEALVQRFLRDNKTKEQEIESLKNRLNLTKDSSYSKWLKTTVKMYETMDSKKAAILIENYSDNEARDLIYSMKNKKAAEILSNLDTERVLRLTRSK